MNYQCQRCEATFHQSGRGRTPRFCSSRCRTAAHRARRLPDRMTRETRWVRADGKRPVQVDGSPASSTDPGTWTTYREAKNSGGYGVMLGDGLACWDLDHCFTGGVLDEWARERLSAIEDPIFVERSLSGEGLHVFVESWDPSFRSGRVEFYSHSRFIRVTGDKFEG